MLMGTTNPSAMIARRIAYVVFHSLWVGVSDGIQDGV